MKRNEKMMSRECVFEGLSEVPWPSQLDLKTYGGFIDKEAGFYTCKGFGSQIKKMRPVDRIAVVGWTSLEPEDEHGGWWRDPARAPLACIDEYMHSFLNLTSAS